MSTDVTQSSTFKSICSFNPENQTIKESGLKSISSVVSSVISHLQTTDHELDSEAIATFSQKIGLINSKLEDGGKGTPFSVALYTMDLLVDLRKNLSPENQDVLKHPFVAQLKDLVEQDTIEDQAGIATQIYRFQKNVLNPALLQTQSREELAALRPLVKLIFEITPKVADADPKGILNKLKEITIANYNYTYTVTNPTYTTLLAYEPGSISNLENPKSNLTELQQQIGRIADGPHMTTHDKVTIYHAYLQIQAEFGENGAELNEVIDTLETTLGLHKGIKSGFPLELTELLSKPISGELAPIAKQLAAFERDHLIPALQQATTREELTALEPLLDQCIELKSKVISGDKKSRLENSHNEMINLWNAKFYKTDPNFAPLVAYTPGKIKNLSSPERREQVATSIHEYIEKAIPSFDHPIFKQDEKMALYEAVLQIQTEFQEHGDGKRLEPTAKALREALSIPEPELVIPKPEPKVEPKAKSGVFAMWEKRASGSGSENSTPKISHVAPKKEISPEVRRQKSIQIIQEKLGSLDLQSQFLSENISDIKRQIRTLRSISGDQAEFKHLEKALDALQDPTPLAISDEEHVFMKFLGKKHNLSKVQLRQYQAQEKPTVINAKSELLKTLKKSVATPDRLDAVAQRALATESANAKQMRFRRFTDIHAPNPALSHNFTAHYPALIQTFELFTRETVLPDLEKSWIKLATVYDSHTGGKFSELLTNYSYMDPSKQFATYANWCQKDFFKSLDLGAIDHIPLGEINAYLAEKVEAHKTDGADTFDRNYEAHFQQEHLWLFDNYDKIVLPHNQGDNDNTNLGKGVCYNNSLSRMSTLMREPTMDRSTLPMGSTERTRFHQNLVGRKLEKAKEGTMAWDEATLAIKSNCEVYGLRHHHTTTPFSSDGGLYENLAAKMKEFSDLGYSQVILGLRNPKTKTGHAVNLIFDQTNGIYSIEDDNLGRVNYSSLNELQTQAKVYFKTFYPDNTELTFECYRLA